MIKLNYKGYPVTNWLKNNLKTHFFDNFVRKLGLIQELGQLIFSKEIFLKNIYKISALKASAIPLYNFGK